MIAFEGLFIYNPASLNAHFEELLKVFIKGFKKHGVKLLTCPTPQAIQTLQQDPKKFRFALMWDLDANIAKYIENEFKIPVFNSDRTIRAVTDRALTFLAMRNFSIPTPSTVILPYTFNVNVLNYYADVIEMVKPIGFPFLVKERYDVAHDKVYLVTDESKFQRLLMDIGMKALLVQQYIEPANRHILQVLVIGGKVFAGVERFDTMEGEYMKPYPIHGMVKKVALRAARAVEADFCAVDILLDAKKRPLVFSIKSNPDILQLQTSTGVYLTWYIARYVLKRYNEKIKEVTT